MDIPVEVITEWLDSLKCGASLLYRDSRLNSGLTKEEMQSEAEGIKSAVYYISRKIREMKDANQNQ